jgi:glutamate synthase (NADPH/NADH) large chain
MSLGALSPEAHGALNIAMNRIGARSASAARAARIRPLRPRPDGDNPNSAVKQIASGRFGVTAEYLNQCREIEIKVAQGAKPGEGGQLPGFKVTEIIARLRHSTPGVMLISPPPHHDIYSIEDLAQLIYDLKQINPDARVTVKLVSMSGIGAIAAGVAKAKADTILIAGHNGGTGASPAVLDQVRRLALGDGPVGGQSGAELNNLRHSVACATTAACGPGATSSSPPCWGRGVRHRHSASLIAMGCLMVRQCHSNTCPVGVCSQDESPARAFTGTPTRSSTCSASSPKRCARSGHAGLPLAGRHRRPDRPAAQVSRGGEHLDDLDLNPAAGPGRPGPEQAACTVEGRNEVPDTLDARSFATPRPSCSAARRCR